MQARFELRKTGIKSFQVWNYDDLVKRVGEADVVVASGMWKNDVIPHAVEAEVHPVDQLGHGPVFQGAARRQGRAAGSAAGVNARAVAEHAIALILADRRGACPRRATISTRSSGAA